ncbi:MAG TPA: hypothetical protein VMA74_12330 [Dyella sp.]|uniref:hypothetical protein n=1 Tax=Dyella sp. TaxID=1869338 RepID=UPI002B70CED6|nr:hypothetical protein [Dyella sp.]HUB90503.1 hypothetical protein [Dyella sp.]
MKVHLGLAGLPYEVELRFWLACKLLMSSSTPVQLHKWEGKPCDILAVDLDSEQGQIAYEMAIHGDARIIFISSDPNTEQLAGTRIDRHATASAIAKLLENLVSAAPRSKHAVVDGLLGICLLQGGNGHEVLAQNGMISIILRDRARRVYGSSRVELENAKQHLLDAAWRCVPVTAPCEHQYEGLVCGNLDSFLVSACLRHRDNLAMISNASYRLSVWPDFISFPDNREALRLSSALYRKSWHVADLAEHCGVTVATANAFCWAMRASGALRLDDSAEAMPTAPTNEPLPLVQRVARHLGLKARQTPA